jgi:hypothetical protein
MDEVTETCQECGEIVIGWLDHESDVYTFRCENMTCLNFWQVPVEEIN